MALKSGSRSTSDILAFANEQNEQLMAVEREIRAVLNKADNKKEEIESELRRRVMRQTFVVTGPLRSEECMTNDGFVHRPSYRQVHDEEFVVTYVHFEHEGREDEPARFAPLVTATYKKAVDRGQFGGGVTFWLLGMNRFDRVDDRQ